MLDELEANWLHLEKLLRDFIARKEPSLRPKMEEWLNLICFLPVSEKTLYLSELMEPLLSGLTTKKEMDEWKDLKKSMIKNHKVKDLHVMQVFEENIDQWIQINRKRG
jgi:hypothetical protein